METRVCKSCEAEKDISEFYFLNKERRYRLWECKPCKDARTKRNYTLNESEKLRRRISAKAWAHANPEKIKAFSRKTRLKREYGLTLEQYDAMVSRQGGRCALCDATEPGGRWPEWHVDHCHKTGKVRALLCAECNRHLGIFEKMLDAFGMDKILSYILKGLPNDQ